MFSEGTLSSVDEYRPQQEPSHVGDGFETIDGSYEL